jgi:hypothetical protein
VFGEQGAEEKIWIHEEKWWEAGKDCIMSFIIYFASPHIIKMIKSSRIRCLRNVARMGEIRNAYKIFIRKSQGKRKLGRRYV